MKWIRPIISLIAVIGINIGFFIGKLDSVVYMTVMAVAVTWWYRSRDAEKTMGNKPQ